MKILRLLALLSIYTLAACAAPPPATVQPSFTVIPTAAAIPGLTEGEGAGAWQAPVLDDAVVAEIDQALNPDLLAVADIAQREANALGLDFASVDVIQHGVGDSYRAAVVVRNGDNNIVWGIQRKDGAFGLTEQPTPLIFRDGAYHLSSDEMYEIPESQDAVVVGGQGSDGTLWTLFRASTTLADGQEVYALYYDMQVVRDVKGELAPGDWKFVKGVGIDKHGVINGQAMMIDENQELVPLGFEADEVIRNGVTLTFMLDGVPVRMVDEEGKIVIMGEVRLNPDSDWVESWNKTLGEYQPLVDVNGNNVMAETITPADERGWVTALDENGYAVAVTLDSETVPQAVRMGLAFDAKNQPYLWQPETKKWKAIEPFSVVMDQTHDLDNLVEVDPVAAKAYRDKLLDYLVLINPVYFEALGVTDGDSLKAYLTTHNNLIPPEAGGDFFKTPEGTGMLIPYTSEIRSQPYDKPINLGVMPVMIVEAEEYEQAVADYKNQNKLVDPDALMTPLWGTINDPKIYSARIGLVVVDIGTRKLVAMQLATTAKGRYGYGFPKHLPDGKVEFTSKDVTNLNTYLQYLAILLRAHRYLEGNNNPTRILYERNGDIFIANGGWMDQLGVVPMCDFYKLIDDYEDTLGGLEGTE